MKIYEVNFVNEDRNIHDIYFDRAYTDFLHFLTLS